jgi:NADP-dependent aldehyde dehydrogenase
VTITGQHWIAGQTSAEGTATATATFTSINPRTKATGEVLFHNATPGEVNRAARAAAEAFGVTRLYPAEQLAAFLDQAATEVESLGDELLQTADGETALGIPRLTSERGRTTGQLRAFASLLREGSYVEAIIDTALPERQPPRPDIRRMLFPIGPVAVFSASNFPFAFSVAGGDSASAFAAGCPVVVKAHPGHPATSELTAQAINRAVEACGFPAGFFSMLQGESIEVGQMLVKHPDVQAVGFTGSQRAGRALYDLAATRQTPIPVYAEMGSINPVVILPSAIATRGEALAEGLVNSVTLGSGQFCTNPGLILVLDNAETNRFIDGVTQKMQEKQPGVLLNEKIATGLASAVAQTQSRPGVTLVTGGESVAGESFAYANTVLQTTAAALRDDPLLQSEMFGAATLFVVCDSFDDLRATVEHLHGNLTTTIHAENSDLNEAGRLFDLLREKAGRLIWNGFPTGVEVVHAQQHGGPYPATTSPGTTSVGTTAIKRFLRPVAYQNMPAALLPLALKDENPLGILRVVNGQYTREATQ